MANGVADNLFLVNAPAGSGKTTWIRKRVEEYLVQYPRNNVLCITFTNRAAEELSKDLESDRAYFGTIHSFINDFISSFFSHNSIINLYFEIYEEQIQERILNVEQNINWTESNEKYKEKYGQLDLNTVRSNIETISYNQAPFNSLLRGSLSHDDLISFTRIAVDKFPVIKKKISDKYQLIFIDEYQDTSADVLHIFYTSILEKKSELYLLGDKMQQIYKNYNGEFEDEFKTFNKSLKLSTNYRTTPKIVDVLNNIYNDETLIQNPYEENSDDLMDFQPNVLIANDVEKEISDFKELYPDALVLYLTNKARFHNIGAGGLYDAYSRMEKYKFGKKYSAIDILIKEEIRNNDALMSFLFELNQIAKNYTQGYYGEVFKSIRKGFIYCNSEKYKVSLHSDKKIVKNRLETIIDFYNEPSATIGSFLDFCNNNEFIKSEFYSGIVEDTDYQNAKDVSLTEVIKLTEYLSDPRVSTQHGVKGESHDTVVFVAENSTSTPVVHMSKFFELWSNANITLKEFDSFYFCYKKLIQEVEFAIGMKCSDLNKNIYPDFEVIISGFIESFASTNVTNHYYINLLKNKFDKYIGKKNVTNAKDCLKEGNVYGSLCAYRLFYVGCSRSRKNLKIIINKKNVEGFEINLCEKLRSCGFEVSTDC